MMRLDRIAVTPSLGIAAACAMLALVADLGFLARMTRSRAELPVAPLRLSTPEAIAARAPDADRLIRAARARQPFEPLSAPPQVVNADVSQAAVPIAQPRLVGTVVGGAESFVVMAMPEGNLKVVHVGERAGSLKLRSVSAGGAVFDDINGDRVTLRPPTPGAEPQP
jgi:hypothetical protein